MYYKILNSESSDYKHTYSPGLNIFDGDFSNPEDGFYFTTVEKIFRFLEIGTRLVEIQLPSSSDPNFRMVMDPNGDRTWCNKIILGNTHDLTNPETFKMLKNRGANIHYDNYHNPLRWACEKGHSDVVAYLIQNNADVNVWNGFCLQTAASYGHYRVAELLVKNGANVSTNNDEALQWAVLNGKRDIVKLLVDNGANIRSRDDNALLLACEKGFLDLVEFCVDNGANVHVQDDCAIRNASKGGHLAVVRFLVQRGANVRIRNNYALTLASLHGHMELANYLTNIINGSL